MSTAALATVARDAGLSTGELADLKRRHKAAVHLLNTGALDLDERWELLAAVVWPTDERLEDIQTQLDG
jgi:hypothetical protein